MNKQSFSVKDILKRSYKIAEDNLWSVVGTFSIIFLASIVVSAFSGDAFIVSLIFSVLTQFVFTLFALSYADGKKFEFITILEKINFRNFIFFFLAMLSVWVLVAVGFVLLIIPGIILGLMMMFVSYLVIEDNLMPFNALRESRKITDGYKKKMFLFILALIGINILGLLAFGIGLLFTAPFSMIACATLYRELKNKNQNHQNPSVEVVN